MRKRDQKRKENECKKRIKKNFSFVFLFFLRCRTTIFLVFDCSFFVCFTFEREGRWIKTAVLVVLKKTGKEKERGNSWLVFKRGRGRPPLSQDVQKSESPSFFPLEGEPEAVADVDPDHLEDALAGHELDEQDAEEAHLGLVFLRSCIFSGSRTA